MADQVVRTEKLTKSYGKHRGIIDVDLESRPARSSGSSGPTAPARRRRSASCSTSSGRRAGPRSVFGIDSRVDPVAIHRRIGYLPGEFALYDRLTGGQTLTYFANLRGGVDPAYQASLIERLDLDPSRRFKEYSQGQQAEDRPRHRAPAPARAADPRRADVGARPARPADGLRDPQEAVEDGRDGLPLEPHPVRGREELRSRGDHPRRPPRERGPRRRPARPRPPPGGAAVHRSRPGGRRSRPCRASARSSSTTTSSACASRARSRRSSRRPRGTTCSTS